jgi:NAD(P)H-hydrate epimerase
LTNEMTSMELPALNREQVREMARRLVEEYGIVPLQTMENAGRNLAQVAKMMLDGDLADRPVVVLAGRGSKGGSGLAAARHLLNWGAWVQVLCSHPAEGYTGAPAQQLHTLQAMGAPLAWAEEGWELPPCDLIVDAITGMGLHGEPQGKARDLIQLANSNVAPILSLDVPSGVDGESGEQYTPHIRAAATLTLALPKVGLLVAGARLACGDLYLGDVSVPLSLYEELGLEASPFFGRDPIVRWEVVDNAAQVVANGG